MQRIFSIIGWIGTALVFGALALTFVGRAEWEPYRTWVAWAGLALVLLYTLSQWREIIGYFGRRQARYGAVATIGVAVALAITVGVNYIASRQNKRWDLTAARQNSLSEQTVKLLQGLTAPVKFTVFERQTEMERFRGRLTEYAYNSSQVSVDYIDPDTRPVVAREFDIQAYGTVVIDYMGKRERVTSDSEQDLTNGLIKAMSTMARKVYYLQGHGEKEPNRTERDGFSAVSGSLRRDNYEVERLVLAQMKEVPDDATVVLIAGPTSDILETEDQALRRYLARAGKLMVMLDPPVGPQAAPLTRLEAILKEYGITPGTNVVVDLSGATNDPSIAVAATYPMHAITERFATLTLYPLARSINFVEGGVNGRTPTTIVETSRQSWAEANLASLSSEGGVSMDEASGDKVGPIPLGVAVSAPVESPAANAAASTPPATGEALKPEIRIVVFGDSDFPSNAYAGIPGNMNFFANAISWLAQQESLIAIRPTEAQDRRVAMTPQQQTAVFWSSILVMPGLVFLAGIYTWWRRR
jgi:ABC-type uncharacterized transport system involved in gliding motility auxiliary subunit